MRTLLIALTAAVAAVTAAGGGEAQDRAQTTAADHSASTPPIMDLALIAVTSDFRFVGRTVALMDVTVERVGDVGFWASSSHATDRIFVLPAEGSLIAVRIGDTVSLQGELRRMFDALRRRLDPFHVPDEHVFVYAYTVRPAWPPPSGRGPAGPASLTSRPGGS